MFAYPKIFRVRQKFHSSRIEDVGSEVEARLARLSLGDKVKPGQSVAITAGSRGITNIGIIIRSIVKHLRALGAEPFIVPAMGSHGGATATGQQQLIANYGIGASECGCPIRSGMETVVLARAREGFPIYLDRHASSADWILACNRVKPHTDFTGEVESGLLKMMAIGLGKHEGAKIYHRAFLDYGYSQILKSAGREILSKCNILAGLAILENGYKETSKIVALAPEEFLEREKELLVEAKQLMAKLPFPSADILLVDEIGKNISGTGMDTNVVGRKENLHGYSGCEYPRIKRIVVRGLTPETAGNAFGIGIAEFCRTRAIEQMDRQKTQINCLTANRPACAAIPIHFDSDREILDAALPTIGLSEPDEARLLWISNTSNLTELECSAAYWEEANTHSNLEITSLLRPLPLDEGGNLPAVSSFC